MSSHGGLQQPPPYRQVRPLPDDVIDRIAAGEVIERPASVVKELLENALDAGSDSLRVYLEGGGLGRIEVIDNGRGMSPEDLGLCVERHATSKLTSADDLFHIETLGFRGEALSSIAAVARVTITTRQPHVSAGQRLTVHGGERICREEVGCPVGTRVEVCDLFFNTPARRKFMRAPATEQSHAVEACLRVMLGARRGGVVVEVGQRRLLDIPEQAVGERRIKAALGRRVDGLYEVSRRVDGITVRGFIASPSAARGDTRGIWLFVNGRFVRDRMLQRALQDALRSVMPAGRYPVAVIHIDVDPAAVDVNVHPQKTEVRFGDGNAVFRAVASAVTAVAAAAPWASTTRTENAETEPAPATGLGDDGGRFGPWGASEGRLHGAMQLFYGRRGEAAPDRAAAGVPRYLGLGAAEAPVPFPADGGSASALRSPVAASSPAEAGAVPAGRLHRAVTLPGDTQARILGRVMGRFVLAQVDGSLLCIDERAARGALAWDSMRRQLMQQGHVQARRLLLPEVPAFDRSALDVLMAGWEGLPPVGFEIEPVGPERFAVKAVPAALGGADAAGVARAVVARVADASRGSVETWLLDTDNRTALLEVAAHWAACGTEEAEGGAQDEAEVVSALARRGFRAAGLGGRAVCRLVTEKEVARWVQGE